MPASQSFHGYPEEEVPSRSRFHRTGELGRSTSPTGTSDEEFTFIFRIKVDQNIPAHETILQSEGTGQSGFFVYGKQAFYRTMCDILRVEYGQFGSDTDTVVGSQCCPLSFQPLPVYIGADRVCIEIMFGCLVLFTHHIHVRLQYDLLQIFFPRSCRFHDQQVPCLVGLILQTTFLSEPNEKGSDFLLLLRRTRNLTHFFEKMKNRSRFQIVLFHNCSLFLVIDFYLQKFVKYIRLLPYKHFFRFKIKRNRNKNYIFAPQK